MFSMRPTYMENRPFRVSDRTIRDRSTSLARATCRMLGVSLFLFSGAASGQQPAKLPDSVMLLAKKYDDSRKKLLQPILDSFVAELQLKVVPALTRAGKADIAVKIQQAAEALKNPATPVLPWIDAPFPREVFAMVQASHEWQVFSDKFIKAEAVLNNNYKTAIDREQALFQSKGDPLGVIACSNETRRVEALKAGAGAVVFVNPASPVAASTTIAKDPPKGKISTADRRRIESYFVGKTWATVPQNGGKPELFFLSKNGTAARRNNYDGGITLNARWEFEDDGTVRMVGAGYLKSFTFLTAEDATMIAHEPPANGGDAKRVLKVTTEKIEGVK
jgi:hypothetical protein